MESKLADTESFLQRNKVDDFWQEFLKATGRDADEGYSGEFSFEETGNNGAALLSLVLSGKKTAITSAYDAYEIDREPLPVEGELFVVVDYDGIPQCIIETNAVSIVPFDEVPWDMASREGQDENLEQWRERQSEVLEEDAHVMGYEFNGQTKIVFELFNVIYRNTNI